MNPVRTNFYNRDTVLRAPQLQRTISLNNEIMPADHDGRNKAALSAAVSRLNPHNPTPAVPTRFPAQAARMVATDMTKAVRGPGTKKAAAIAAQFRKPELALKFYNRVSASDEHSLDRAAAHAPHTMAMPDTKMLRKAMHYSGWQPPGSKASRLATRAALSLAFAHGADQNDLKALRSFLDKNPDLGTEKRVLQHLNEPALNIKHFIQDVAQVSLNAPIVSGQVVPSWGMIQNRENDLLIREYIQTRADDLGVDLQSTENMISVKEKFVFLADYTSESFRPINQFLRTGKCGYEAYDQARVNTHVENICSAMDMLPDWHGIVTRGAFIEPGDLAKYEPGQTIREDAFVSTSADRGFDGNTQFIIESRHGKNISDVSRFSPLLGKQEVQDGTEILFKPGTHFEVLEKTSLAENGVTIIVMREVDAPREAVG